MSVLGQVYDVDWNTLNMVIPDNNSSGVVNSQLVSLPDAGIRSVSVTLNLSSVGAGGFNGDMYVLLSHGGKSSVLMNRVGKSATNPFGYGDGGLSVTFSDSAPNGDFHIYQTVSNPMGNSITGLWAPDARRDDPAMVTDSSSRTAFLSGFNGLSDNGRWNLYLVDLSRGAQLQLNSWSLHITVVPEPRGAIVSALCLLGLAVLHGFPRQHECRIFQTVRGYFQR